jgi:hypothetical protein
MKEGNIILNGKYPGDKNEVVRIFPIYHKLSKNKKINLLILLNEWVAEELKNTI